MSALVTVSISMHVRCAECQSTIHLGAIVDRARCPRCGAIEKLPPERWRRFLDAATNDAPTLTDPEQELRFDDDEAWIIVSAKTPHCAGCDKPLPPTAAENGRKNGKCFCVGCGAKIGFRPVPPAFATALPRVTHLLGEDGTQLKSPDAPNLDPSQVVSVHCPDCGGNIQPDGRSRAVRCPYCSILVVLTQGVWSRIHQGDNEPHSFFLVHDSTLPKPLGRPDAMWKGLDDLCCDAHGNVFGIGEDENDKRMVFALDRQLKTTWIRKGLALDDHAKIAWRNDGAIVVWSRGRYSAILLRASDGDEIGKVGGQQPTGLDRHVLDLSGADHLAVDTDGTFLFSKHRRLARCAPDGSGQLTWPPSTGLFGAFGGERLHPFTGNHESDYKSLEEAGDRPHAIRDVDIKVGWDGLTYLRDSDRIGCYDRTGKCHWHAALPEDHGNINDFGVDARGIVYLLCHNGSYTSSLDYFLPGGKLGRLADGHNPQTPIREERTMAVHPDGTTFIGDSYRGIRIFSPDGRCLYVSEESRKDDKEHEKRAAEARDDDRAD